MILHYMSASRIKKYLQCAESYHQSYENGVRGDATHLKFGTVMHTVFERWYQGNEDIVAIYQEEWDKADLADPEFYDDGFDILQNFLSINDRDTLSIGFEMPFAINIATGIPYDTNAVDFSVSDEVRAFLKTLESEEAPIIFGFIDRLSYDMDEDLLKIVDYKTSRIPLTQYEADEDVQLSMYALVARYLFPEYRRVVSELQYVRSGIPVRTYRTNEQLDTFREWLISIYYKIKNDTTHKATLNKYCGWCDAKAGCVAYKELIEGSPEDISLDGMTNDEMDKQLENVAISIKILEGRKKEIEATFKDKLRRTDNKPIDLAGGSERFLANNARISYNVETILELFPDESHRFLSVNKTEVDKIAKGNTDIMNTLEATGNKYFIAPTLRKKNKK